MRQTRLKKRLPKISLFLFFSGVNVLNTKSELERVMEKRNRHRKNQEKIVEQEATKTPFQKMLEERAKRLEMIVSKKSSQRIDFFFLQNVKK